MSDNHSIPPHKYFWIPVLRALREMGGAGRTQEVKDRVIKNGNYTEEQIALTLPKTGKNTLNKWVSFALSNLKHAGYLKADSKIGQWELTLLGETVNLDSGEVERKCGEVKNERSRQSKARSRAARQRKNQPGSENAPVSDENADSAADEQSNVNELLLEKILALSPRDFEYFCKQLLGRMGFENLKVTQKTKDGGFDGDGFFVINPLVRIEVVFECKRYQGTVGLEKVDRLIGATNEKDASVKRVLITTGSFSREAEQKAKKSAVELIDGEGLVDLCKEHGMGAREVKAYELDYAFFDKFKGGDDER